MTTGAVMKHISNYFELGFRDGNYSVNGGKLSDDGISVVGNWVYIQGSIFHDGVYLLGTGRALIGTDPGLPDEDGDWKLWLLAPPADFLSLCDQIAAYDAENQRGAGVKIGEYSESAEGKGWESVFADALNPYRRDPLLNEVGV